MVGEIKLHLWTFLLCFDIKFSPSSGVTKNGILLQIFFPGLYFQTAVFLKQNTGKIYLKFYLNMISIKLQNT